MKIYLEIIITGLFLYAVSFGPVLYCIARFNVHADNGYGKFINWIYKPHSLLSDNIKIYNSYLTEIMIWGAHHSTSIRRL
jgi:hypothetical protein